MLGIAREDYAACEAGMREIPSRILERAADVFGVELAALFEDDDRAMETMMTVPVVGMTDADVHEVIRFERIVKQYQKMRNMLLTE